MKRYFALIALVLAIGKLGIAQPNNEISLPHFDKLRVTNQIKVYLTKGDNEKASVVAKGIAIEDVITEVTGKTLEITLKRGVYKDISVEVYLTYNELRDIYVSGSGRVSFQGILVGDKVVMNASNGEIDAKVDLRTLDASASKGGSIRLDGKLGSYEAKISTGGVLSALDLQADSVFIKVNTKGIAKIIAKELLDADIKTGATLTLSGTPNKKNIKSGIGVTILEQ
ncbi:MAG: hypothetical protein CVT98_07110 [Bacteroidetes bacterium HGW-Bacteroidetes-15]|nr:MAG: hypothetical protein CVT98_07110 [Bacteroidetes bacterium HGW-Bacteroidetes-15]